MTKNDFKMNAAWLSLKPLMCWKEPTTISLEFDLEISTRLTTFSLSSSSASRLSEGNKNNEKIKSIEKSQESAILAV